MFNLKRTMPKPTHDDANQFIRQRGGPASYRNTNSVTSRTSPRRFTELYHSTQ